VRIKTASLLADLVKKITITMGIIVTAGVRKQVVSPRWLSGPQILECAAPWVRAFLAFLKPSLASFLLPVCRSLLCHIPLCLHFLVTLSFLRI
jgi:nitrate reductase gamma subunit